MVKTGELLKEFGIKVNQYIVVLGDVIYRKGKMMEILSPKIIGTSKVQILKYLEGNIMGKKIINWLLIFGMVGCFAYGLYAIYEKLNKKKRGT